jgi:hypothetical protein
VYVPRSQDPNGVVADFLDLIGKSLDMWQKASDQVKTAELKKQVSIDAFQRLATGLEEFRSDWHIAAINRDSTRFRAYVTDEIKKVVATSRYAQASDYVQVSMGHLNVSALRKLLDPRGFHLSFDNTKDWQRRAGNELSDKYAKKLHHIIKADRRLLDTVVAIRNCVAHNSQSSIESMNGALSALDEKKDKHLRRDNNRVRPSGLGAYLWAWKEGTRRVERYHARVRAIVSALKV